MSVTIVHLPIVSGSIMTGVLLDRELKNYYSVTAFGSKEMIDSNPIVPVSQSEICGDRLDNDINGLVDENCPVESSSVGNPVADFNRSKTLRIAVVCDIDANQGLTTQLEIANNFSVQAFL